MSDLALMQQALEALEVNACGWYEKVKAVTALRARLAEPEPVFEVGFGWLDDATKYPRGTKLYTAPPVRRPLTLEEIMDAVRDADLDWHTGFSLCDDAPNRYITLIRAIERAHKIGGNDE